MLINSCTIYESQKLESIFYSQNFRRNLKYEPISLIYKGKSILYPGQKVENLDSSLSFRPDTEGEFREEYNIVRDYLSLDDNISIELKQGGYIGGILYFSSDQKEKQIFNISGNWTIGIKLTEKDKSKIIEHFTEKLFPILKGKLKLEAGWKYENRKENYVESFSLNSPNENGHYWNLDYKVKMK